MNNTPIEAQGPSLNNQILAFKKTDVAPAPVQAPKVELKAEPDKVEISETASKKEKPKKKGLMEKFANMVGSFKKFFARLGGYAKGGIKGAGSFLAGSTATVGSIFAIHKLRQGAKIAAADGKGKLGGAIKNLTKGLSNTLKPSNLKNTLKTAKGIGTVLAGIAVGTFLFIRQIYKAKLAINNKTADINHKYYDNPHTV